ncbi:MAG: hypothetical protein ACP5E4_04485 [Candidatus Aenigmatarchaeota archaeon]
MERLNQKAGIFEGPEMLYEIYERMLAWDFKIRYSSSAEKKPYAAQVPEMHILLIGREAGKETPLQLYRVSSTQIYPLALLTGSFCYMPHEMKALRERPYNILLEPIEAIPDSKEKPLPSEIEYAICGKATPAEEVLSGKKWRCVLRKPVKK